MLCASAFLTLAVASCSADDLRQNTVIDWSGASVRALRDSRMGAPMAARALAVVHTCMYDAWAAYDEHAIGTQLRTALLRPVGERTVANKQRAVSYAAYRALVDLLPLDTNSVYKPLMRKLGYDPDDNAMDIETPTGIGNVACAAVLEFRHHDKANQLGDMVLASQESRQDTSQPITSGGSYSDWSRYRPVNPPGTVPAHFPFSKPVNPQHWQPLTYIDSAGNLVVQMFAGAQWCYVTPFAFGKGDELRAAVEPGPYKYGSPEYQQQAQELVDLSADLTDRQKMIAEYWSDGPYTEQPPGHWAQFAQFVSVRDHHTLNDDVKMFFVLANAMLDASIAAWDAKRTFDSVRPITAIPLLFNGKKIRAWGGPGEGTVEMNGSQWIPYQLATFPTPPFPEYVSGHSTYSAAAARILVLWTGSDHFDHSITLLAGSSKIEPGITPAQSVVLKWDTFTAAADEAGMSRRYGGIHFALGDTMGRKLGRLVAEQVWAKAQSYFDGTNTSPAPTVESSTAN